MLFHHYRTGLRPTWIGQRRSKNILHLKISAENFTNRENPPCFALYPPNNNVKDFFWFKEGALVTYGASDVDIESLLNLTASAELHPFHQTYQDQISFTYANKVGMDFERDIIQFSSSDAYMEKLTSAHCMYRSLRLEILEEKVDLISKDVSTEASKFFLHHGSAVASIRPLFLFSKPQILTLPKVYTFLGNMLKINSELNGDELKSPPDYLWDSPKCEKLYEQMQRSFMLKSRLYWCNESIEVARKDMELVRDHLNTKHSSWLEWIIIVLITIEIIFSLLNKSEKWKKFRWEHLLALPTE